MIEERPIVIDCAGDSLVGILHETSTKTDTGIVIAVGGPQYRVGSHRQFVLMARRFANAEIPVLRFDFRGMGDSQGESRSFEFVNDDIRAAIDAFTTQVPALTKVVLLGLCDAASANLVYCHTDRRVAGLILMNPWVRTTETEAKTYLRHYYMQRLLQKSFWRKALSGEWAAVRSLREFLQSLSAARGQSMRKQESEKKEANFVERMLEGMVEFGQPILILLSGRDLVAREFMDLCRDHQGWKRAIRSSRSVVREVPGADHTMSSRGALDTVSEHCVDWVTRNLRNRSF